METIVTKYSGCIALLIYNKVKRALTIEFKSGGRYRFYKFTPQKFNRFKKAKSKGRYFQNFIRGQYESRRLPVLN